MKRIIKKYAVYIFAVAIISDSAGYWVWGISGDKPHIFSIPHFILFIIGISIFRLLLKWHKGV